MIFLFLLMMAAPVNEIPKEYFPLQQGQCWKYRYKGLEKSTLEIRVVSQQEWNGKHYFKVTGWFGLSPLRKPIHVAWTDGTIYLWDGKEEKKWAGPGITGTQLTMDGKDLIFQDCVGCADAGSTFHFRKGKGIVSASFTAIWGEARYELMETKTVQTNP